MNSSRLEDSKQWIQSRMRSKAVMWAGIATGLGLALGIAGRIARRRRRARSMPTFVLVEAC